jgi:hypothetical protein
MAKHSRAGIWWQVKVSVLFLGLIVLAGGSIACWQAYDATSRFGYLGKAIAVTLAASIAIAFGLAAYFHTGRAAVTCFVVGFFLLGETSVLAARNYGQIKW